MASEKKSGPDVVTLPRAMVATLIALATDTAEMHDARKHALSEDTAEYIEVKLLDAAGELGEALEKADEVYNALPAHPRLSSAMRDEAMRLAVKGLSHDAIKQKMLELAAEAADRAIEWAIDEDARSGYNEDS